MMKSPLSHKVQKIRKSSCRTSYGYQLRVNKNVINWYLNIMASSKKKNSINRKIKLMRKVITDAVDKRFGSNDEYIDYPKVDVGK